MALAQGILCALALAVLVGLKAFAPECYEEVAAWYRREAAREITFPGASSTAEETVPSPAPSAAVLPGTAQQI